MTKVFDLTGKVIEEATLPKIFDYDYKPVTIKKAVNVSEANKRQKYGTNVLAGKRSSAHYHGKRHYRFSMMNRGMARISRIHGKVGYMAFRARVVPQAVKGRRAHPPKAEKNWDLKLNKKESKVAVMSAIAATANNDLVKKRGHTYKEPPIIFIDDFEKLNKSKEVKSLIQKIVPEELERSSVKKVRAGKGKARGRKYKKKKGILFVFSKLCPASKAVRNIPGCDSATAKSVDSKLLAPGTHAGRLTIYTKSSLLELEKRFSKVKSDGSV